MIAALTALALAADLPRVLSLDEAVRIFKERGFDLLLADAQAAAAQADQESAGALANPQLSGGVSHSFGYDAQCAGCSANGVTLGLSDPSAISSILFGQRGLRLDVARAALKAARSSRDDALRTLSLQLRQAVLDTALQQEQQKLARELAASAGHTRDLNQRRYQAGAISEAELARAEVAALEAEQQVDQAEQQLKTLRFQLAFLLGAREPAPDFEVQPVLDAPLPPEGAALQPLVDEALQHRPDVLAAQSNEERAQAAVDLARRLRVPPVGLSAQLQQQGTGNNALQPLTLTVGASIDLPVLYQQQGEIAHAEADLRSQRVLRAKAQAQAVLEVQTAQAALGAERRLVERMRARLLQRARQARDLVQVQYEKGAASLLDLLDAQRTFAQTQAEYLKNLHDFWLAIFQLDAAVGRS